MSKIKFLACLMMLSTASCGTTGNDNSFCAIAKPIYINDEDHLSPATGREILEHDKTGGKLCGWGTII